MSTRTNLKAFFMLPCSPVRLPQYVRRGAPKSKRNFNALKLLTTFFTGQLIFQGISFVTGFLLLRWMSVEQYAQLSVSFAFQSTINLLVDVGLNGCILALVGSRGDDPKVIGGYIRVARTYRGRMFYIVGGFSAVAFPIVIAHQSWGWLTKAILLGSILASVFFDAWEVYRAPLLIHQRLVASYRADIIPAVARLTLSGVLYLVGGLLGWVAAWLSAVGNLVNGLLLRQAAANLALEPPQHDPEVAQEMFRYLAPLWPGMIFYAFQGQITISLISFFGSTRSIAEVAALGRLGQIFIMLTTFNTVVVMPRVARQDGMHLLRTIGLTIGSVVALLSLLTLFSFGFPRPFLSLLGSGYSNLSGQVGLTFLGATLNYLSGSAYGILVNKRWVTHGVSWANIVLTLCVQVLYVLLFNIRTTGQAMGFMVATSAAALISPAYFLIWHIINIARSRPKASFPEPIP